MMEDWRMEDLCIAALCVDRIKVLAGTMALLLGMVLTHPELQPTRTVALYLVNRHRAARPELTDGAVQ